MKRNIIEVVEYIHVNGLDNSSWNVEKEEVPAAYYGKNLSNEVTIKPHIALFQIEDYNDEIGEKSDYSLESSELGTVYIYEL